LTTSNFLIDSAASTEETPPSLSAGQEDQACAGAEGAPPSPPPTPPPPKNPLILIDFGLAKSTESAEERAVDLYVLERAILSTHPQLPDPFFDRVLSAYSGASDGGSGCATDGRGAPLASPSSRGHERNSKARATLTRLEQVRQRGRKRECFG
jgi:TP53 regulating kinase-like protein